MLKDLVLVLEDMTRNSKNEYIEAMKQIVHLFVQRLKVKHVSMCCAI